MLMDVLTFRWVTVIAEYLQSETVADLLYVICTFVTCTRGY